MKIYQYNLSGNYIQEHENGAAASWFICDKNKNRTDVYKALKSKTNYCKGFLWTTICYMNYPIKNK